MQAGGQPPLRRSEMAEVGAGAARTRGGTNQSEKSMNQSIASPLIKTLTKYGGEGAQ